MKTRLISVLAVFALNLTILANLTGRYDNLDTFTFSDGTVCPLKGTAKSNSNKALNLFKNRYDPPDTVDMDDTITLSKMLKPGDDLNRFDPSFGARITGFVADVKSGGTTETCNCGHRLPEDRDTHIELSLYPNAPNTERIVIEVTPRMREIQRLKGIDWSTKTLSGSDPANPDGKIKGKWIEVIGWMMFDTMHVNEAENTNRATQATGVRPAGKFIRSPR